MKVSFYMKSFFLSLLFVFLPCFAHADITTGLVGQWSFEEGSGSTAADSSSSNNTGTLQNSPTWISGQVGSGALSLDGTDDYVNVPDSASLDLSTFTVSGWINLTSNTNNWKPVFTKENASGGQRNFGLYVENTTSNPRFHYSFMDSSCSGFNSYNSSATAQAGTWQHVTMTYDGSSFKFYINGSLDSTQTVSGAPCSSATAFRIGEPAGAYDAFPGSVDEVRVYNRALSAADVSDLYSYTGAAAAPGLGASGGEIAGYAWSDTIGWLSFNCSNHGTCGTVDYSVTEDVSGNLTGYAWSENIGWVQFGGLTSIPSPPGTYGQNAQVVNGELRGWAKALSADDNGWDGWISLSSNTGITYGVTKSGTSYTGYAWGSDVVGWLSFNLTGGSSGTGSLDVTSGGVSLNGNGAVPYGTIPTFEWDLTGMTSPTCTVSKTSVGGTAFNDRAVTASGSYVGSSLVDGAYTFELNCAGVATPSTVSFTVAPEVASFTLGATEGIRIQFLTGGSAISETQNIFVTAAGGYSNPVTVSITGYPTPPAGVTFTYSFGGGAFSATPTGAVISSPYNAGTTFRLQASKPFTSPVTVTLTGTGAGAPSVTKDVVITPTATFDPKYREN